MDKMKDTNLMPNSISNSASSKHDAISSAGYDNGLTSDILEIEELNKDRGKLTLRGKRPHGFINLASIAKIFSFIIDICIRFRNDEYHKRKS